jgi:hypothetical protein
MPAMPTRKRLQLALKTTADISNKTEDLRGIMAKMSGRQREIFKDLIKGEHIVKVFIKRGMLKELEEKIPTVTRIDGKIIPVSELKWSDYDDLELDDKKILGLRASDLVGRNYKDFIVDIKWMFKMLSIDALKTVVGIMEDKTVAPQTRLSAAQDILNRGGYEGEKETQQAQFPVNVKIVYDKKPISDNPLIEGEYAQPE